MKFKHILFLILVFSIAKLSYSQEENAIYIEKDNNFKMIFSKDGKNVLQSYLYVKSKDRFDSYYFIINDDFKEFEKSVVLLEIENFRILTEKDYKKLPPCDLHEFFSDNRNIYLVYKKRQCKNF